MMEENKNNYVVEPQGEQSVNNASPVMNGYASLSSMNQNTEVPAENAVAPEVVQTPVQPVQAPMQNAMPVEPVVSAEPVQAQPVVPAEPVNMTMTSTPAVDPMPSVEPAPVVNEVPVAPTIEPTVTVTQMEGAVAGVSSEVVNDNAVPEPTLNQVVNEEAKEEIVEVKEPSKTAQLIGTIVLLVIFLAILYLFAKNYLFL